STADGGKNKLYPNTNKKLRLTNTGYNFNGSSVLTRTVTITNNSAHTNHPNCILLHFNVSTRNVMASNNKIAMVRGSKCPNPNQIAKGYNKVKITAKAVNK